MASSNLDILQGMQNVNFDAVPPEYQKALQALFQPQDDYKKSPQTTKKKSEREQYAIEQFNNPAIYKAITGHDLATTKIDSNGSPTIQNLIQEARQNLWMIDTRDRIRERKYGTELSKANLDELTEIAGFDKTKFIAFITKNLQDCGEIKVPNRYIDPLVKSAQEKLREIDTERKKDIGVKKTELIDRTDKTLNKYKPISSQFDDLTKQATEALASINAKITETDNKLSGQQSPEERKNKTALLVAKAKVVDVQRRLECIKIILESRTHELKLLKAKVARTSDYKVQLITDLPDTLDPGTIYFKKEDPHIKYFIQDPLDSTRVNEGLLPISSAYDGDVQKPKDDILKNILNDARGKQYAFAQYVEYDPNDDKVGVIADSNTTEQVCPYVEELIESVALCEKELAQCKEVTIDPKQHWALAARLNHTNANAWVRVVASTEREKGQFIDEVVTRGKVDESKTKYGLEGHHVYRGVHLDHNIIKRTSCETNTGTICIETSIVKDSQGMDRVSVIDKSGEFKRTPAESKQSAREFADALLDAYVPGSGSPITLSGGPEQAEYAAQVYAALLAQLSDPDHPKYDPKYKIKVDVPGCEKLNWALGYNDPVRDYVTDKTMQDTPEHITNKYRQTLIKTMDNQTKKEIVEAQPEGKEIQFKR